MLDRRTAILGGLLTGGGLLAGAARLKPPAESTFDPQAALPDTVGNRMAFVPEDVILPQDDALSSRLYDALVIKSYGARGARPVTAVLAYGRRQDYSFQVHRPEICYPASGFEVVGLKQNSLAIGGEDLPLNIMRAKRGRRRETVLFWTRIGDQFPQSLSQQRLAVLRYAASWPSVDGALLRLSVSSPQWEEGGSLLKRFAQELIEAAQPGARALLLG